MEGKPNKAAKRALRRGGALSQTSVILGCAPHTTEPIALPIREACRVSGFSRSKLYLLNAAGEVVFLRNGSRIMVTYESLKAAVAALPRVAA